MQSDSRFLLPKGLRKRPIAEIDHDNAHHGSEYRHDHARAYRLLIGQYGRAEREPARERGDYIRRNGHTVEHEVRQYGGSDEQRQPK